MADMRTRTVYEKLHSDEAMNEAQADIFDILYSKKLSVGESMLVLDTAKTLLMMDLLNHKENELCLKTI